MTTDAKTIFSLDIRSLALFRVLLGSILILDMINRFQFVPYFYSDEGIISREIVNLGMLENAYHFQLMFLSGSEWFSYFFFTVTMLAGLFLLLGYYTKIFTFIAWLFYCSIIVRDPFTTHAADTLYILLLFWALFLPIGKYFSIDSLLNKSSGKISVNKLHFSVAAIALYIQVSLVYVMTGIFKGKTETWLDGTHLYLTLSRFDYAEPFAMLIYPYYELLNFLTHFTLYLELFGPLLLVIPFFFVFFRLVGILLFLGLQISIGLTMDVGLFPLVSSTALLVFIPAAFWNYLSDFIANKMPWFHSNLNSFLANVQNYIVGWFSQKKTSYSETGFYKTKNFFAGLVIVYIIIWNLSQVTYLFINFYPPHQPGYFLKLDQRWNMFVTTAKSAGFLSAEATLEDGTVVDLMSDKKVEHGQFKHLPHIGYTNYRWRIFFSNRLRHRENTNLHKNYIEYLRNNNFDDKTIDTINLVYHKYVIDINYNHSALKRQILY